MRPPVSTLLPPVLLALMLWQQAGCLDNGVARTPPMGWISWERFECNTNCDTDPDNCISERLFRDMATHLATDGYLAAGWQYVVMGDCWLDRSRAPDGRLRPDPRRFPGGMRAMGDFLHARGLKFGVYEDVGTKTCAGFPGSEGHWDTDAQTFADWGVDFLKFDACNADIPKYYTGFPAMRDALNRTGRHIVYSCEWPMYEKAQGGKPNYTLIAETCNVFRQLTDIYDSWDSVIGMIEYFGDDPGHFSRVAGPGAWNDPDQVVIGNFGLSEDQEKVQMALYAILASPMFMSNDLRRIRDSSRRILLNRDVIAVNQDPLGIQGKRLKQLSDHLTVWTRPVVPRGSLAVAFLNTKSWGGPTHMSMGLKDLGLISSRGYNVTDLFEHRSIGLRKSPESIDCYVDPTGVVMMKFTVL